MYLLRFFGFQLPPASLGLPLAAGCCCCCLVLPGRPRNILVAFPTVPSGEGASSSFGGVGRRGPECVSALEPSSPGNPCLLCWRGILFRSSSSGLRGPHRGLGGDRLRILSFGRFQSEERRDVHRVDGDRLLLSCTTNEDRTHGGANRKVNHAFRGFFPWVQLRNNREHTSR